MTLLESKYNMAALPSDWYPHKGLYYPMKLKLKNGESIVVPNYNCHHRVIKKLFAKNLILPSNPYDLDFL